MKALERRQALMKALNNRRHDKICNLAFEFGVNERTIRRDIDELSLSFPIYTDCSRNRAGVYVQEGYYLETEYLKKEEQELLERYAAQATGEEKKKLNAILKRFGRY